jgi:hypothetical protein
MAHITPENGRIKELAEAVQAECLMAARQAWQDASENGLCEAGAIEAALGAIQLLDTSRIISRVFDE